MALIKCPECGKEISDKAKVCIHCGYPMKEEVLNPIKALPEVDDENNETITTFVRRSCAGEIVTLGILLEIVLPALCVPWFFIGAIEGIIFGSILAGFYVVMSILAPFSIVKTVKLNTRRNSYREKRIMINKGKNIFVFEGETAEYTKVIPFKDIVGFDGPHTLVVTHLINNRREKLVLGYTTRKDVLRLRKIHEELKENIQK